MNHQMKIFLSDGFGGADLMGHVMYKNRKDFAKWFDEFLPYKSLLSSLEPPSVGDPSDLTSIHLYMYISVCPRNASPEKSEF
jgi:hypothetical protein